MTSDPATTTPADRPDVDVLVVGAGPAGLSAALVLGRSRRTVLVVDDGAPRNQVAGHLQGYLGSDGLTPADFLARGRAEVARYGVQVRAGRVDALHPSADGRVLAEVSGTAAVRARRVVVATGLSDRLPPVPGVAERWGREVLHCPYCHGWEVRDARLVALVTAAEQVDKALSLTQWSDDVQVVLHGLDVADLDRHDPWLRPQLDAVGVPVVGGPVSELVIEQDRLVGVGLASGDVLPCDAVAVDPRLEACDRLLVDAGAEVAAGHFGEFVVTDETGRTGVPGIWAAGNVSDPQAQVVLAAAAGYRAALAVDQDLIAADVESAVTLRRS